MDKCKELQIIFDLRNMLIELYPDTKDFEKYIIANELLIKMEKGLRDEDEKYK